MLVDVGCVGRIIRGFTNTTFSHHGTSLGNYKNQPVAIGGLLPGNIAVEMYDNQKNWKQLKDFDLVIDYICEYSIVTFKDDLYLFGK